MRASNVPEEAADFGNAGGCECFEAGVVDGNHGIAAEWPTIQVCQSEVQLCLLAGPVFFHSRLHVHNSDAFFGWYDDFADFAVDFSIGNCESLDVKVGLVRGGHGQFHNCRFALQFQYLRGRAIAVLGTYKQQHGAVCSCCADLQAYDIADGVFLTIRNQLEVTEAEVSAIFRGAADEENDSTFLLTSGSIGDCHAGTKLPGIGQIQTQFSDAVRTGDGLPVLNFLFDKLLVLIPGGVQQANLCNSADGLSVRGSGLELQFGLGTGLVVSAIHPCEDLERIAGCDDAAGAGDGSA